MMMTRRDGGKETKTGTAEDDDDDARCECVRERGELRTQLTKRTHSSRALNEGCTNRFVQNNKQPEQE